jgi:hypothetical protein
LEKAQRELVDFANTGTSVMGEHFKQFSANEKNDLINLNEPKK